MNIGIVLIATGKYDRYVFDVCFSFLKYFDTKHKITFHLFTDKPKEFEDVANLKVYEIRHEPFPYPTLHRYKHMMSIYDELIKEDFIFYSDVDMRVVAPIGDDLLSRITAVIHAGFVGGKGTPERRIESNAFIPEYAENKYYAGGFQGGVSYAYLEAVKQMAEWIEDDKKRCVIAVWHDESHWNKYLYLNPPTLELSPSYCYPESWKLPFKKKILALDKNHKEIRS